MAVGFEFDNRTGVIKYEGTDILEAAGAAFVATGTKTADYTALITDSLVPVSCTGGNVEITLPDASTVVKPITIMRLDNGVNNYTCTITPGAGDTIMGEASATVSGESAYQIFPIGTDWRLL